MSKTTGDDMQSLFKNIEQIESNLANVDNHNKAVQLISEMRTLHGKAVWLQCQLLKSATTDPDTLIKISTNESTLHLIHCIIRKCEKKIFGGDKSSGMTETVTKTVTKTVVPAHKVESKPMESIKLDSSLFDMTSSESTPKSTSKSYAMVKMNPDKKCYDISVHGLSQSDSTKVQSEKSIGTEIMKKLTGWLPKPTSAPSPQTPMTSPQTPMTSLSADPTTTEKQLQNITTTEANELLGPTEKAPTEQKPSAEKETSTEKQNGGIPESSMDLNKPTVINFWADWCGYSNRFTPVWSEFKEFAKTAYPKLQVLDLNVKRDPELMSVAKSAKVQGYPTLVFFCDGKMEIMTAGEKKKEDVCKFIEEHSKGSV